MIRRIKKESSTINTLNVLSGIAVAVSFMVRSPEMLGVRG
jgi:hypothetical protein